MSVTVVSPSEGEVVDLGPLRTRILEDGTGTDGRLGVVEVWLAPGTPGPPQHIHRQHDETFFVLTGTVRFTVGEEQLDATVGTLVTTPIGVPHTFSNPDPDHDATMLCTVTPDLYINYFRELAAAAREAHGRPEPEKILEIMGRYATEPYIRPPDGTI